MTGMKIFEFTYAAYPAEDGLIGLAMVLLAFVPHVLPIIAMTRCVTLRCKHHFLFFLGLVVSHGIAKALKKTWKQPRPENSFLTGYGMPSDHAMFLFFATTYLVSYLSELPSLKRSSWLLSTFSTVFLSLSVCYSRLYLGVHSEQQVLVGMSLGLVFGRVWFVLCRNYLLHWRSMGSFVHGCIDACEGLFLGKSKEV